MVGEIPVANNGREEVPVEFVGSSTGASISQANANVVNEVHPPTLQNSSPAAWNGDLMEVWDGDIGNNENDLEAIFVDEPVERDNTGIKKKRQHRHAVDQIKILEEFFKECLHPDDSQRKELSRQTGLHPLQVKYWFQNKRNQLKKQDMQHESDSLQMEKEKLHGENISYRHALSNKLCLTCGGPTSDSELSMEEFQLRLENISLREQIEQKWRTLEKYIGKSLPESSLSSKVKGTSRHTPEQADQLRYLYEFNRVNPTLVMELALKALSELIRKGGTGYPLWVYNTEKLGFVLNESEYLKAFPRAIWRKQLGWESESSIESVLVIFTPLGIVDALMEPGKFSDVFCGMVSTATILRQLSASTGGNFDGVLQLMSVELQALSPLVPTRKSIFVRYCKQMAEKTWVVVDISLDSILPTITVASSIRCLKWPSGCIIHEVQNGISKVTWVEHVMVDDQHVHYLAKPLLHSGLAYGARRWVSILNRQSGRLTSESAIVTQDELIDHAQRTCILGLAKRMVSRFCGGLIASDASSWRYLCGDGINEVRILTSDNDHNMPSGVVISASLCIWLPIPPTFVHDYLCTRTSRFEWDFISSGGIVRETAQITAGQDMGNCISLLRIHRNYTNEDMIIVQETRSEQTASFLVYAPLGAELMTNLFTEENAHKLAILPSGYTVLPTKKSAYVGGNYEESCVGSHLTASLQALLSPYPSADDFAESMEMVNYLMKSTIKNIKAALFPKIA